MLGIDRLNRRVGELEQKIDALAREVKVLSAAIMGHTDKSDKALHEVTKAMQAVSKALDAGLKGVVKEMAATKADLDQALQTLTTQLQQTGQDVTAAIQRLQDKIDQGSQPEDLQPELDSLNAFGQALSQIDAAAVAAGQTPAPTPEPPTP